MNEQGTYGQRFEQHLRQSGPTLVMRTRCDTPIALTELRHDGPAPFMTPPLAHEEAFDVALVLRDYKARGYWEEGRPMPRADLQAGDTVLYDFRLNPVAFIDRPFHSLHLHLPLGVLDTIASDLNASRVESLARTPGAGVHDTVIATLARSLLPALERPERVGRLFVDHLTRAIAVHVAQTYGGMRPARAFRGGLAPRQERRAKEIIAANLDGALSLEQVAQECGLSTSHFARAFRQSTGVAPHRWLVQRRVEAAKELLRNRDLALTDVALQCGFADQSHFTRTFTRTVGSSPGTWRRQVML
jgi:AraC-like DNA-binding protein